MSPFLFWRSLVGSHGPAHRQNWLRRDASRRPAVASSSPRSIRSQSGSTLGRRATRSACPGLLASAARSHLPLLGEEQDPNIDSCDLPHPWGTRLVCYRAGTELLVVEA